MTADSPGPSLVLYLKPFYGKLFVRVLDTFFLRSSEDKCGPKIFSTARIRSPPAPPSKGIKEELKESNTWGYNERENRSHSTGPKESTG